MSIYLKCRRKKIYIEYLSLMLYSDWLTGVSLNVVWTRKSDVDSCDSYDRVKITVTQQWHQFRLFYFLSCIIFFCFFTFLKKEFVFLFSFFFSLFMEKIPSFNVSVFVLFMLLLFVCFTFHFLFYFCRLFYLLKIIVSMAYDEIVTDYCWGQYIVLRICAKWYWSRAKLLRSIYEYRYSFAISLCTGP